MTVAGTSYGTLVEFQGSYQSAAATAPHLIKTNLDGYDSGAGTCLLEVWKLPVATGSPAEAALVVPSANDTATIVFTFASSGAV